VQSSRLIQILGPPSSRLRRPRGSSGVGRCAKGSRYALAAGFVASNSVASFSVPGLHVVYRPARVGCPSNPKSTSLPILCRDGCGGIPHYVRQRAQLPTPVDTTLTLIYLLALLLEPRLSSCRCAVVWPSGICPPALKSSRKYAKWQMWVVRCVASLLASGTVPG
jgi:hypothetical protein